MRGEVDPQAALFSYFSPESRVPAEHPLRAIKADTDAVLKEISAELGALYSSTGRPSIPPERLLKGQLLIALYSVRSDRQFCQMLDYNILFRWFLDMSLEEPGLDQSCFSRLRERLVNEDIGTALLRCGGGPRARPGTALLGSLHCGRHADRGVGQRQELQAQGRPDRRRRTAREA